MTPENVVALLVHSYDLPSKVEERILQQAQVAVREQGIVTLEKQFHYIDSLVEKSERNWRENRALRLDSPRYADSNRTYHDTVGNKSFEAHTVLEKIEDEESHITAEEAVNTLEEELNNVSLEFLRNLLSSSKNPLLDVTYTDVKERTGLVLEKLRGLTQQYLREGKIVLPARPVKNLSLNKEGIEIDFGTRNYRGNPLAFYLAHQDIYGGMGREELNIFDSGLHKALCKTRQIELAIPERGNALSSKEIEKLIATKRSLQGNINAATKELGHSFYTTKKYWLADEVHSGRKEGLSVQQIAMILPRRRESKVNVTEIARRTKHGRKEVRKYLLAAGYEIPQTTALTPKEVNLIKSTYDKTGKICATAKKTGHSRNTVSKYVTAEKLPQPKIPEKSAKITRTLKEDEKDKVVETFFACGENIKQTATQLKRSRNTVKKVLEERGRVSGNLNKLPPEIIDQVITVFIETGFNYMRTSKLTGVGRSSVTKYCRPIKEKLSS